MINVKGAIVRAQPLPQQIVMAEEMLLNQVDFKLPSFKDMQTKKEIKLLPIFKGIMNLNMMVAPRHDTIDGDGFLCLNGMNTDKLYHT